MQEIGCKNDNMRQKCEEYSISRKIQLEWGDHISCWSWFGPFYDFVQATTRLNELRKDRAGNAVEAWVSLHPAPEDYNINVNISWP
jgi:hypothetical protein